MSKMCLLLTRQISPCLPHHPDRRSFRLLAYVMKYVYQYNSYVKTEDKCTSCSTQQQIVLKRGKIRHDIDAADDKIPLSDVLQSPDLNEANESVPCGLVKVVGLP